MAQSKDLFDDSTMTFGEHLDELRSKDRAAVLPATADEPSLIRELQQQTMSIEARLAALEERTATQLQAELAPAPEQHASTALQPEQQDANDETWPRDADECAVVDPCALPQSIANYCIVQAMRPSAPTRHGVVAMGVGHQGSTATAEISPQLPHRC